MLPTFNKMINFLFCELQLNKEIENYALYVISISSPGAVKGLVLLHKGHFFSSSFFFFFSQFWGLNSGPTP
jgi:hypothetical protein